MVWRADMRFSATAPECALAGLLAAAHDAVRVRGTDGDLAPRFSAPAARLDRSPSRFGLPTAPHAAGGCRQNTDGSARASVPGERDGS
jgi:hypothetical protein